MKAYLRIMIGFVCILNLFHEASFAGILCNDDCCNTSWDLSEARLELGYAGGRYIFLKRSYAELGLFLPAIIDNNWCAFADVRGYRFNDSKWGSSAGAGLRFRGENYRIIGANLYYDYREGHHTGRFHRLGAGLEWLGDCWDVRLNGYFPLGKQVHHSKPQILGNYIGNYFVICHENEYSFGGFDAEVGVPLFCLDCFEFYGALGPYYYRNHKRESLWGGLARLELNWKTFVTLEALTTYDKHNRTSFQGRVMLRLPLNFMCNWQEVWCACRNLLTQPVCRNGVILTDHCCNCTWNW